MLPSTWLPVFVAFSLGLAAAFSLEANWLRCARFSGRRPWLYGVLAGLCLALAVVLWTNGRPPQPPSFAPIERRLPTADGRITPIPALPPPLITNYELRIMNYESRNRGYGLPITDYRLPLSPTRLRIPALKINRSIVPVPVQDGTWDVTGLDGDVGLLATTGQYLGDDLAMVFAGHMTFPDGKLLNQGAFADLQYTTYGTEVIVEVGGETAVYQVSEIGRIPPDAIHRLYLADGDSILLLTCTDWNDDEGVYTNRLLIRATRVETEK